MKRTLLAIGFSLILPLAAQAQFGQMLPAWQDIRQAQPAGLQLKLTLPKDHFYQGEVIPAELEFSNSSADLYHLWVGTYDRSGRIPDIGFKADDAAGQPVRDPLAWYFMMGGMGGGLGNISNLGEWKISLPVNQWLSFDKPGVYTVYAWSNRVQKGDKDANPNRSEGIALVSDKIQITIDPLPPDKEKQIIDTAKGVLALGGEPAQMAREQLRYLGTPASRAALVPLLADQPAAFDAAMGLCASPDPAIEAGQVLNAVSSGRLPLNAQITDIYSRLKAHDLLASVNRAKMGPQDGQQFAQTLMQATTQARDEITAAAAKASGGKGDAYLAVLLTKFQQDSHDPATREELAKHQLELSQQQAEGILSGWDWVGGDEFLPLAEKMAAAPAYNISALKALIKSRPGEALGLLKMDAQQPKSNFFGPRHGSIRVHRIHLNPAPDPAMDDALRTKLKSGTDLETTAFYIQEFASPALLPDVRAVYQEHAGKWACEIQNYFLWYLLRCDPKGGADALATALASRASTGCYKMLLGEVLTDRWDDAALPIVLTALDDPEPEVALGAAQVLALHANAANVEKAIAALERLDAASAPANPTPGTIRRGRPAMIAQQLLDNKDAHFTPDQQQRLQKVAQGH